MSGRPECAKIHTKAEIQYVRVLEDKLADVFVHINDGLDKDTKYAAPEQSAVLDQVGCLYQPLVLGMQLEQTLEIKNSDPFMHNVNAQAKRGAFNVAMIKPGVVEREFKKPQVMVPIECNVHPWMKAWIGVVAHPFFAVTDDNGQFEIKDVPPGNYTVEFWHSKLGTQSKSVQVSGSQNTKLDVQFEAKP